MKYIQLGNTGLRVSPITVGCMSYGSGAGRLKWTVKEEEALPVLDACYQAGLNIFDTANVYSNGESEEILGKAIKKYGWKREHIVVATKLFAAVGDTPAEEIATLSPEERDNKFYTNQYGLSRKNIFAAVDASLRRLGLDYIDLYQIHRFDSNTPVKETMQALHDLVRSGKVRYIGASSMWAHQLLDMQWTARTNGWTEFSTMQNLHNPMYREEEREMIPACKAFGMGIIPWSPLAMGYAARPHDSFSETARGKSMPDGYLNLALTEQDKAINQRIEAISKDRGTSMAVISLAWCLSKPFIDSPIVGLSNKQRVDEAIQAIDFKLTDEEIKSIDDLYKVPHNIRGHT